MGLGRYLAIRTVNIAIILAALILLNFFMFHVLGDPTQLLAEDPRIKPAELQILRHNLGVDRPVTEQLLLYLQQLARGDLGLSWQYHQPVLYEIWIRLPNTLMLLGTAHVISTLLGIATGIRAASRRGKKSDVGIVTSSLFVSSLPVFWIGFLLIAFFAIYLKALPAAQYINPYWTVPQLKANFLGFVVDILRHLVLPVSALVIILFGGYTLLLRNTMIDVLAEDYIVTAKAKGVTEYNVLYAHALKNAYLPVITSLALNFGGILSGAILTETVFNWFGLGSLIISSVFYKDWPLLQGLFLIIGFMTVLANLVADILYGVFDPRVKVS